LVASVNATLAHLGRPQLPETLIAKYVGNGAALLMARALGTAPAGEAHREGLEYFLAHYAEHKLDQTRLYPGVAEGLARLEEAGYGLAVLSNKPARPSREIVAGLGVGRHFFAVEGGNSFAQKKPDPVGIFALATARGVAAGEAAMIGDSSVDIRAGRNAGAYTCGVTYGFQPETLAAEPPDWTVASFAELTQGLLGRQSRWA